MVKLFSNFDTDLDVKLLRHYIETYSEDDVLLVRRDKLFFVLHGIVPMVILALMVVAWLVAAFAWTPTGSGMNLMKNITIWSILAVLILFWGKRILMNAIDYELDFAIATPQELVSYEQTGFFKRQAQTVGVSKIKTVTVKKWGIWNSLFNVWRIIVLSEGDKEWNGDIEIYFVHNPDKVAQQMKDIFNTNTGDGESIVADPAKLVS